MIEIGGKSCEIKKFGAVEGWKLLHRIGSILGPAVGLFQEENYERAMSVFFEKCSEDELISLLKRLTAQCLIDGREIKDFNSDLADYGFTILLITEVFKENFGDFFLKTLSQTAAIRQAAAPQTQGKRKKRR